MTLNSLFCTLSENVLATPMLGRPRLPMLLLLSLLSLLFVRRPAVFEYLRVQVIEQKRYFVRITPLAAQELFHAGRCHHVRQHDRPVAGVVQVAYHVLIVHVDLRDKSRDRGNQQRS